MVDKKKPKKQTTSKKTKRPKFEDCIDVIDVEIAKRRSKWGLTALAWMDYDDVSQIIRIHIYKKWHLYDPSKNLLPWIRTIISNQLKNLKPIAIADITKTKTDNSSEKKRKTISQEVRDKVWNRDGGKCVECDSNENLEFDHIIPVAKGGANTYRNLQLLCEPCNRSKRDNIG